MFLPGEFHGQRSLLGYSPWGRKELDMTERLNYNNRLNGRASLVAQTVNNLPAMQETQVRSLGGEDTLEKERLLTPGFLPGEFH